MQDYEREVAMLIDKARGILMDEQYRIERTQPPSKMRDVRIHTLDEWLFRLLSAKTNVDPRGEVIFEYQTPLPF